MLPARKIVSTKTFHEEHSSNSFGLTRLSYELGFHDEKNLNGISLKYMKNGHVKMTHC